MKALWIGILTCGIAFGAASAAHAVDFIRGDVNNDLSIDIGDPIATLDYLFGGSPVGCLDAADANDDGSNDIGDAIFLLSFLFSAGTPPPAPFPDCGADPGPASLGCATFAGCCPPDIFEPNDVPGLCQFLGAIGDSDSFPAGQLQPTLGGGDHDWFCYSVDDEFFGDFSPRIDVFGLPTGESWELHVEWECLSGGGSFSDDVTFSGGTVFMLPSTCGVDSSVEIRFRIRRLSGASTCAPYTIVWGDD